VVVDVGPKTRLGLPIEDTFYHHAKTCLISILQRKLFSEKCRDYVGIVAFGTDETNNDLATDDQYQHISVLQRPRLVDWQSAEAAEALPRGSSAGDWLDAMVVAMDLLHDGGDIYSSKKLVLMTDFSADFNDDNVKLITDALRKQGIELTVIGVEEPSEEGEQEEEESWSGRPLSVVQRAGRALAATVVAAVDGIMCGFEAALPQLEYFEKRGTTSANWNAVLEIGEDLKIPVVGRIMVKRATPPTWQRGLADATATATKERSHHLLDEAMTPVEEEDTVEAYRYGTSLVPFTEEDRALSYSVDAAASISVLGFSPAARCGLALRGGDQVVGLVARQGDQAGATALSALCRALYELSAVAVTRRVYRRGTLPQLGALRPRLGPHGEHLVWVGLPYAEDIRLLALPPLPPVEDGRAAACDALIDGCMLRDGDGEELLAPASLPCPRLQRLRHCLSDRALRPGRPLPPPPPHVLRLLSPPAAVVAAARLAAPPLLAAFPLTKVQRRTKRARGDVFGAGLGEAVAEGEAKRPRGEGGEEAAPERISTATPSADFLALVRLRPEDFLQRATELQEVLLARLEGGEEEGAEAKETVAEALAVYRRESLVVSPLAYNTFLRRVRALVVGRGAEAAVWAAVRESPQPAGLITRADNLLSDVTEEQAATFLEMADVAPAAVSSAVTATATPQPQEYDDLLDDL